MLDLLSQAKINLAAKDVHGWTVLHHAVSKGDVDIVKILALAEEKLLLEERTLAGSTPLHLAASGTNLDVCICLVELGANLIAETAFGENPLHRACLKGSPMIVQYLLGLGCYYGMEENYFGYTIWHLLAMANRMDVAEVLLDDPKYGLNCNTPGGDGWTPILIAVQRSEVDLVRLFVEHGADLEAENCFGHDALLSACIGGKAENVEFLLNCKNFDLEKVDVKHLTALHLATISKQIDVVKLILARGAYIEKRGGIRMVTPLLLSAALSNVEIFCILLENGADINAEDEYNHDVFLMVCGGGRLDILKYLVETINYRYDLNKKSINGKTAFIKAGRNKSLEVKKYLVQLGADIQDVDNFNLTAITVAAQFSNVECCRYLLEIGVNPQIRTKIGTNALHQACISGNIQTAQFLLDKQLFDINATAIGNTTALHLAAERSHSDLVEILLDNGADVKAHKLNGQLAFHVAAKRADLKTVKVFMDKFPSLLEERTRAKETALLLSCQNKNLDVIQYLIECGSNLEAVDEYGNNALHLACKAGNFPTAQFLFYEMGFDVKLKNDYLDSTVHLAAWGDSIELLEWLVTELEMPMDEQTKCKQTPLHLAAKYGSAETCRWLIDRGADLRVIKNNGKNLLMSACNGGKLENVLLFLGLGVYKINDRDSFGRTAFHLAAKKGCLKLITYLVEKYNCNTMDIDRRNSENALHVAAKSNNIEVVQYLVCLNRKLLLSKTSYNKLPVDMAKSNQRKEVLSYLQLETAKEMDLNNHPVLPVAPRQLTPRQQAPRHELEPKLNYNWRK
ncbi:ankyrin-2-like [Neocloeon triangulifer]|uniref:ankyrin-2-like n=1 Tax=Neocloeon triangulifer TaxID=2078957 RepID=UPI00286F25E0|nr:ankyrin-2-like [Neocloeon triangulifer]